MASELTPYQRDILIRTALGEARGQGVEGMADVIQTIFNRANSGQYPSDPAAVALQNKQYSAWNSGEGGNNPQQFSPNSEIYQTAAQALDAVVGGRPDPTGGALFYHTPSTNPYWASSVNKHGTIERNGHVYYPSRPTPPGEIPSVASLLDVRRQAPTPAMSTPTTAAIRQMTSPTGGNAQLQSALDAYATRERNRVTPASAEERVTARNRQFFSQPASDPFNGDPLTAVPGQVVATIPTSQPASRMPMMSATNDAARRAVLSTGGNQTYAGQDRGTPLMAASASDRVRGNAQQTRNIATTIATIPTRQTTASDRVRGNEAQTRNQATTIASIPTVAAGPTTRPVQTTTIRPSASDLVRAAAVAPRPTVAPRPAIAGPNPVNKSTERLPQSTWGGVGFVPSVTNQPMQSGGLSRDAVARQNAYNATALNPPAATLPVVTPARMTVPQPQQVVVQKPVVQQRVAPVPFQRPAQFNAPLMAAAAPRPVQRAPLMAAAANVLAQKTVAPVMIAAPQPSAASAWMYGLDGSMIGFSGSGSSGGAHGGSADDQDHWLQGRR